MSIFQLQPVLFEQNVRSNQAEIVELIAKECDPLNPRSPAGAVMRWAKGPPGEQTHLYRVQGRQVFIQARTFFETKDPPFGLGINIEPIADGSKMTGRMAFAPRIWAAWWLGAVFSVAVFLWMAVVTGRDLLAGRGIRGNLFWLVVPVVFLTVVFLILKIRQRMWFVQVVGVQNWFQPLARNLRSDVGG